MNSDPTGNFTLLGLSVSTVILNTLKGATQGAILGGFLSMFDAMLEGERDLMQAFSQGASAGFVFGAVFGGFTAFANMKSLLVSVTAKLAMGTLWTIGGIECGMGAVGSFENGNYAQGAYRTAMSFFCFKGAYNQFGSAYDTITNNSNVSNTKHNYSGKKSNGEPNTPLSFEEALEKLNNSKLRPGQTVISRSRVMYIVENYNSSLAESEIYVDGEVRYVVDGTHTTVATTMLGRGSGINMNIPTQEKPSAWNVYWTKSGVKFGGKVIKVIE